MMLNKANARERASAMREQCTRQHTHDTPMIRSKPTNAEQQDAPDKENGGTEQHQNCGTKTGREWEYKTATQTAPKYH